MFPRSDRDSFASRGLAVRAHVCFQLGNYVSCTLNIANSRARTRSHVVSSQITTRSSRGLVTTAGHILCAESRESRRVIRTKGRQCIVKDYTWHGDKVRQSCRVQSRDVSRFAPPPCEMREYSEIQIIYNNMRLSEARYL